MRKLWGIWKGISDFLITLIMILAVVLVGLRFMGLRAYTVLSGSMEPEIPAGALIYVRKEHPESLQRGDVITFLLDSDRLATHRIVEVIQENDQLWFRTKGDANSIPDGAPVHSKNVIGVPVLTIPGAGYLVGYLQSFPGAFVGIFFGAALMLVLMIPDLAAEFSAKKKAGKYLKQKES